MCQTNIIPLLWHFVAIHKAESIISFHLFQIAFENSVINILLSIRLIIKYSELLKIKHHVIAYYTVCKALYSYRNTL
jgi:hypothetical protein